MDKSFMHVVQLIEAELQEEVTYIFVAVDTAEVLGDTDNEDIEIVKQQRDITEKINDCKLAIFKLIEG